MATEVRSPETTGAPAGAEAAGGAGQSLKELATVAGAVAAIAYAAGYIVTTMHLYWWYIYNPTLVSGRYVSVGFCFLCLAAATLAPAYSLAPFFQARLPKLGSARECFGNLVVLILTVVALILLSVVLIAILSVPPVFKWGTVTAMANSGWILLREAPLDLLIGWYGCLLAAAFLLRVLVTGGLPGARLGGVPDRGWVIGLIVLLLVLATYRYAISIYSHILPAVGGGQDMPVQLLFDEKDSEFMRRLGVPLVDPPVGRKPTMSRTVELLEQTDKTYILLLPDKQTGFKRGVEIDKRVVIGTLGGDPYGAP